MGQRYGDILVSNLSAICNQNVGTVDGQPRVDTKYTYLSCSSMHRHVVTYLIPSVDRVLVSYLVIDEASKPKRETSNVERLTSCRAWLGVGFKPSDESLFPGSFFCPYTSIQAKRRKEVDVIMY